MIDNCTDNSLAKTALHFEGAVSHWCDKGKNDKDYYFRKNVFAAKFLKSFLRPGALTLDIGCASGQLCELLHEQKCDVYGVDIAPGMISLSRERMAAFGVHEDHFCTCDGLCLPFQDGTFNLVSVLEVLGYIENHPKYILELRRVLKPGCLALVSSTNPSSLFIYLQLIKRALVFYRFDDFWKANYNLARTGWYSGGNVNLRTAVQARSARALDRFFSNSGFKVLGGFDMYNFTCLDKDPLGRTGLSARSARRLGWNHFGLYAKVS